MTKQEEFLTLVENGEQKVYPEKSIDEAHRIYVPMVLGGAIAIISEVIHLIHFNSLMIEFVFIFMILPMLIGVILTIVAGRSVIENEGRYGVRGVNRKILSKAIHFLDMVHIGSVTNPPRPDELAASMTIGFGSAVYALKRIDPDMAKTWSSTLSEKLNPEVSSKTKWFMRITIFGTLAAIPICLIAWGLNVIGVVREEVFKYIVIGVGIALIILISALLVFVITTFREEPPQGVLDALSEPQLRMDTEMALDRIFQTVREEGHYPLRVLVLGEYEELVYTGLTYTTSREHNLKAAVLFPMEQQRR
jgi:hypothetical protein